MPPHKNSRYLGQRGVYDSDNNLRLTLRSRFAYDKKLGGVRRHVVSEGENLQTIAYRYFRAMPNAEHFWWVIADFQPTPIFDGTLDLAPGTVLFIPSLRVVQDRILGT